MLGQFLGRKAGTGKLRLGSGRIINGSKLMAGGVLVALAALLLAGPPVATHLLPHLLPHHRVIPPAAPPAVSTSQP
jgi:hypothetical protein